MKIDPRAFLQLDKRQPIPRDQLPGVKIDKAPAEPKTELTPEGEQFVIPGAERDKVAGEFKPKQGNLWD